ncbi:unnamed protein product [Caenorhabditis sp. 36 PRJEB53466]|nr:unnamed protein product [Caenorhabditis sp. 36 PRJEB53466]
MSRFQDGTTFKHDEAQKDNLERMFITSNTFNRSLRHTILLASIDDTKIAVLVAGVFPYRNIDIMEATQQFNQDCVMFYDMHYSVAFGGVSFIVSTCGPFMDCKQRELKAPLVVPPNHHSGCHTFIFNVKLDIDSSLWDAAHRYVRLLFGYNLYTISLETTKRDWETEIAALHNRFDTKTKAVRIGEVLLEMLLSGSTDSNGEAFLERGLGNDGLAGVREFTEKYMTEVCRLSRGQLASSARNMCFQRCEFATALSRSDLYSSLEVDENILYKEEVPVPETSVNAWLAKLENEIDILDLKTRHLGVQCLTMMQELNHLSKWISLTKPFAKSMKVNALMKIKRMDIEQILRYIVSNFFPDDDSSDEITSRLFELRDLLNEQKKRDAKKDFDEVKYLEKMAKCAEEERSELANKYQTKLKFPALPAEEESVEMKEDNEVKTAANTTLNSTSERTTLEEPINLDRVGPFFTDELSEKALEVLPRCNDLYDNVLDNKAAYFNSDEIRKIGLMAALKNLAKTLSSPQVMFCDSQGNTKNQEVQFIYELGSGVAHQGFVNAKITNVTHQALNAQSFHNVPGLGRAIQVTAIERTSLRATVIVPTRDANLMKDSISVVNDHIEKMNRHHNIDKVGVVVSAALDLGEAMEVDPNELTVDVTVGQLYPQYDKLSQYEQVFPLRHGELVVVGRFGSNENNVFVPRIMRTVSTYPHAEPNRKNTFVVHASEDGKPGPKFENMIVHPTTQLIAFLHEDKITLGDLKPEQPVEPKKKSTKKNFRDYQKRRDRYREDMGFGVNVNDIQYDVLVQEAMDNGRDLTDNSDLNNEDE